jgi:hypothetical protein
MKKYYSIKTAESVENTKACTELTKRPKAITGKEGRINKV